MQVRNMKQKSVDVHDFSMIPKAEIPRSSFTMEKALKTAFSFSYLVPILVEEVLPGDTWNAKATIVARTATPITPIMDNWHLETFAFFVPNRIVWTNWVRFMGEQDSPTDSISYTIPTITSPANGYVIGSIYDYMGLPTAGQVFPGATVTHSALPLRGMAAIHQTWFRDENLLAQTPYDIDDGPDDPAQYNLYRRGKRHDYFTSCLPWPQKGNTAVTVPLGGFAPVVTNNTAPLWRANGGIEDHTLQFTAGNQNALWGVPIPTTETGFAIWGAETGLQADLSTATAITINALRQSFQIQKLLERDARGGTRYTEIVRSHFGVVSPDARLQRPEYIGGGRMPIETSAIPQTSATGLTGGTTPAGNLAATGYAQGSNGFTYAATEHGYIIMVASARADLTYSQGMRKMWSRSTRYDFYFPVFAMLGEQTVLRREIYTEGTVDDDIVFGYQERWAEYRYNPSQITGLQRPTAANNIAYWHSSQLFTNPPVLNGIFIEDSSAEVVERNFAAGALTQGQQLICDILFNIRVARPLPMYSVPGLIDHF